MPKGSLTAKAIQYTLNQWDRLIRYCQDGRLRLFFLAPYSPKLNSDELVWNVAEGQASGRTDVANKETLRRLVGGALSCLQRSMEKLKRLFHEPNVS